MLDWRYWIGDTGFMLGRGVDGIQLKFVKINCTVRPHVLISLSEGGTMVNNATDDPIKRDCVQFPLSRRAG